MHLFIEYIGSGPLPADLVQRSLIKLIFFSCPHYVSLDKKPCPFLTYRTTKKSALLFVYKDSLNY